MKENNIIRDKSYNFAIQIVNLYRVLSGDRREFVLSKQLLRSGTSIGANIEEGIGAQSAKDFYAKFNIAYKETRETHYWLRLLKDTGYLNEEETKYFISNCEELLKILGSILITMKNKIGTTIPGSNT